jgi:hypothetical protein
MQPIIVDFETWEINSISHEKDNLAVAKSIIHDCCEKEDLMATKLFFNINVTRAT